MLAKEKEKKNPAKYIFEKEKKMIWKKRMKKTLCTQEHLISKHIINQFVRKERKK